MGTAELAKVRVLTPPEVDGWMVPPALTVKVPLIVPEPPRVPPLTATALEAASEPGLLTSSVPAVTFVAPV